MKSKDYKKKLKNQAIEKENKGTSSNKVGPKNDTASSKRGPSVIFTYENYGS